MARSLMNESVPEPREFDAQDLYLANPFQFDAGRVINACCVLRVVYV